MVHPSSVSLTGYGYPYAYGYAGKSAPCVNAANAPVPCAAGYAAYGYAPYAAYGYAPYAGAVWGRKRREAEPTAAAEADPALLYSAYGYPYAHAAYAGYPYAAAALPAAYAAAALPIATAGVYAAGALPHAVAATPYGLVHSSHVGVCTNYLGAQVSC